MVAMTASAWASASLPAMHACRAPAGHPTLRLRRYCSDHRPFGVATSTIAAKRAESFFTIAHCPKPEKNVCICLYFLLCSIFPGERNWGLGIGDWVLRTGHRALALGTGHWALGRGVWGLVVGHCIGHCRLAHGRHQAKAIKATYREVSDEPVWRQTYKSPIIFPYVRSS